MIKIRILLDNQILLKVKVFDSTFYVPNIGEKITVDDIRLSVVDKEHFYSKGSGKQMINIHCREQNTLEQYQNWLKTQS